LFFCFTKIGLYTKTWDYLIKLKNNLPCKKSLHRISRKTQEKAA